MPRYRRYKNKSGGYWRGRSRSGKYYTKTALNPQVFLCIAWKTMRRFELHLQLPATHIFSLFGRFDILDDFGGNGLHDFFKLGLILIQEGHPETGEIGEEGGQGYYADSRGAQEIVDEPLVGLDRLRNELFDVRPDVLLFDREELPVVENCVIEDHRHVEGAARPVHHYIGEVFEDLVSNIG